MFDSLVGATAGTSGAGAVAAWARVESAACARKVAAMAAMLRSAYAASESADRDQWCLDNFDAVAAHIGAAQRITHGAASNQLLVAVALHERFPQVAAVFAEGLITYQLVPTVVQRGALVVDPSALHELDRLLAEALSNREPMSTATLEKTVDAFVAQVDPHAVHRTETRARGRSVDVGDEDGSGMATVFATLFAHDAKAFDARLSAVAETVCPADPRTKDQRRADAIGALAHGNDRLARLCESDDCPAAQNPPSTGVVVYVIASADTLDERPAPAPPSTPPAPDVPNPADAPNYSAKNQDSPQAMFTKPLSELTLTEALTPASGRLASLRPAATMGAASSSPGRSPAGPRSGRRSPRSFTPGRLLRNPATDRRRSWPTSSAAECRPRIVMSTIRSRGPTGRPRRPT
ncbi:DUF222 domain-containing protein [Mycolicibacterium hodleri]